MSPKAIPYGRQQITERDIEAVVATLRSDFLTQGPQVAAFEEAFASYIGSQYAIAVANGTAALHLSALALGVGPGKRVITSPLTFAASANCVLYCGGTVEFCDIDPQTLLLDIEQVRKKLEAAPVGTYAGIIPVDFAGAAIDMEAFRALADDFGLFLLEDSCHAPGGYFTDSKGKKQNCGNGVFADAAIFSFHPVKHIACGEGGMITTNDPKLYQKLLRLRTHGITKNPKELTTNDGGWYYEMQDLGFNYRLSDISAALGLSQLERAVENLSIRRAIADKYAVAFESIEEVEFMNTLNEGHAYHLAVVQVKNRKELYDHLRAHHIYTQVHYIPLHLQPYYQQRFGTQMGDFPEVENYYTQALSLPIFPTLDFKDLDYIINTIKKFYK
ncbi:MAG: UDP-4-amino-4,6-dideoxy-N-acetyl-beta-L-altrosamine transaminase [Flavobacteriaceae bacterium]